MRPYDLRASDDLAIPSHFHEAAREDTLFPNINDISHYSPMPPTTP